MNDNVDFFLNELATIFEKTLKPQQVAIYRDKLRRFSPEQLIELLNRTLEEVKFFPKVSDIYKAAQELGYLSIDTSTTRLHHWEESDACPTCHGEGRLALFWEFWIEARPTGTAEIQRLAKVIQYSRSFDYIQPTDQFRAIFRCKCRAGEVATLSKAWPRLSPEMPTEREVWI